MRARRLVRTAVAGQYVYCATDLATRTEQLHRRHTPVTAETLPFLRDPSAQTSDETKAAIILFFSTLDALAEFDDRGLWTCRGARFSRFGTLIDTAEQFVTRSDRGCLATELAGELQVQVKEPLLNLVSAQRLVRKRIAGQYVYCATDAAKRTEQLHQRHTPVTAETLLFLRDPLAQASDETKAAIILFFSTLDERQRRLYAGLESLRLGHGGDSRIAGLTGLDVHTIAKGRAELLERDVQLERIRRPGAGRPLLEKKRRKSSTRSKR